MYSAKVSTEKYLFLPLILSVGTSGSWTSSSAAASAGALASWSEKHLTLSLFVRLKHAQSVLLFRSELFLGGNFSATSPFMCHVYSLVQWIYWSLFFFWGGEHIVKFFFQEHTELAQRPRGTLVHQFEENLCSASGGGGGRGAVYQATMIPTTTPRTTPLCRPGLQPRATQQQEPLVLLSKRAESKVVDYWLSYSFTDTRLQWWSWSTYAHDGLQFIQHILLVLLRQPSGQ